MPECCLATSAQPFPWPSHFASNCWWFRIWRSHPLEWRLTSFSENSSGSRVRADTRGSFVAIVLRPTRLVNTGKVSFPTAGLFLGSQKSSKIILIKLLSWNKVRAITCDKIHQQLCMAEESCLLLSPIFFSLTRNQVRSSAVRPASAYCLVPSILTGNLHFPH